MLKQDVERFPARELPVVLGQKIANTQPGPYFDILARVYNGLNPADRLRCRDEIRRCQEAKRGRHLADVA